MKRKQQKREKGEKTRINLWQGFVIISIFIFVSLRFFVDGLSYPGFNFFWNIFFFLLTVIHILIRKLRIELDKLSVFLLIYFVISTISTGTSPIKGTGIGFNVQILAYWCVFILIKENFKTEKEKKGLLLTIVISGLLVCIYGLDQYFVGFKQTQQFIYSRPELLKTLPPSLLDRMTSNRVFATFVYPNLFASFLLFLIPIAFFLTISKEKLWIRGISGITLIIAIWNIFLTGSSGGLYVFLFVLQLMFLFLILNTKKLKVILPLVIIFEMLIVYGGYKMDKLPKMSSFVDRISYWNSAIAVFKEHPVIGVGTENYRYYYLKYKLPGAMEAKHPHSILFASLAETGLGGMFFLFLFLVLAGINLFRKLSVFLLYEGLFFSYLAFFLHNLIDFNFINPAVAVLFFIAGGLGFTNEKKTMDTGFIYLTGWRNFLIIFMIIFTGITYVRYYLSQRAFLYIEQEKGINSKLYYLERAEKLYPLNFEIYEKKGDVFYNIFYIEKITSYREQAEILYRQTLALNPLLTRCYRKLALLYEDSGDYKSAEKMYLKLLELYPNKKQYNMEVAMFYRRIGNNEKFNYYYEISKKIPAVTLEEGILIQDYEKWIELQK